MYQDAEIFLDIFGHNPGLVSIIISNQKNIFLF